MSVRSLFLAALVAAPAVLSIQAARAELIGGERLMQACTASQAARQADCDGYVAGVLDTSMRGSGQEAQDLRACLTKSVTLREIRDAVVRYGRDHAEAAHGPGPALVLDAVRAKYRCGGAK